MISSVRAVPSPPPAAQDDRPAISEVRTTGLALGAFSAPPVVGEGAVEKCGEVVADLLEAYGEGKAMPYASAGGVISAFFGGLHVVEGWRRGDVAEIKAGLVKFGVGGLGIATGSGLFATYPTLQGGLEVMKTVLGSAIPPSPVIGYGIGIAPVLRQPSAPNIALPRNRNPG